jgi:DNA ligase-1
MFTEHRALQLIDEIAAEPSRLEKEKLLADLMADELGRYIVSKAYDPFVTYGITPVKQDNSGIHMTFRPVIVDKLLTELATRRLTGKAAERELAETMAALSDTGQEILFRIVSKDLKCGIAATTINSVEPGFIPVFAVMRAHKFEEKRIKKWPQIVEPKLDGYRFTFLCKDGKGGFFSRSGIRQESADHLVEPMMKAAGIAYQASVGDGSDLWKVLSAGRSDARSDLSFMVDGEMIMPGDFNANGKLRSKESAEGATFHIFDLMSYADFDAVGSVGKTYLERRRDVEAFVKAAASPVITMTPRYFVNSHAEIHQLYEAFRGRGLEGAMVKNPDGLYDKKKSYGWLKIKAECSEDIPVIGAFPGEPNTKYSHCLGGIIVDYNGVEVRVGGGFTDQEREDLWLDYQHDINNPDSPTKKLLGRLAEVLYHEITPDKSLRHPRFKRWRDDKAGEVEIRDAA